MRRKSWYLATVIVILAASGFVPVLWRALEGRMIQARDGRARAIANRPPPPLPIRAEDYRRYPRAGFGFVFEEGSGRKTRIDTFRKTLTSGDSTIHLELSNAELDTIYRKMIAVRFFEYPEPHPPATFGARFPRGETNLVAQSGTFRRQQHWSTDDDPVPSDEWKRLYELVNLIRTVVAGHPEFATPEAHSL